MMVRFRPIADILGPIVIGQQEIDSRAVSTNVIKDVELDVSFIWERTAKPQERIDTSIPEKDDIRLLLSIG